MSILTPLYKAYRDEGFDLLSGLAPARYSGLKQAAFTWLIRNGQSVTDGYGMALSEVQTLEAIVPALAPKNIFVIGNSFGFSTIALALICPKAHVVSIDAGLDAHSEAGLRLTDTIARKLGLNVTNILATSPQHVPTLIEQHFKGKLDLALIDGLHTNAQIVKDAEALRPYLTKNGALICHDVLEFGLQPGLKTIGEHYATTPHILHATTSGLGIVCPNPSKAFSEALEPFAPVAVDADTCKHPLLALPHAYAVWQAAQNRTKLVRTLKRSLQKRLGLKRAPKPSFHTGSI